MNHQASESDLLFLARVESCNISGAEFDHRAHLQIAYLYLMENDTEAASEAMRDTLLALLKHLGADPKKYHETITRAWILAVRHFMKTTEACQCADEFIDRNPAMLDSRIMMTHYSAETLFSDTARRAFAEPDLEPIPRYDEKVT